MVSTVTFVSVVEPSLREAIFFLTMAAISLQIGSIAFACASNEATCLDTAAGSGPLQGAACATTCVGVDGGENGAGSLSNS